MGPQEEDRKVVSRCLSHGCSGICRFQFLEVQRQQLSTWSIQDGELKGRPFIEGWDLT